MPQTSAFPPFISIFLDSNLLDKTRKGSESAKGSDKKTISCFLLFLWKPHEATRLSLLSFLVQKQYMQDRYITLKIHYSVFHTSKSSLLLLLETSITTNDGRKWTAYTNKG